MGEAQNTTVNGDNKMAVLGALHKLPADIEKKHYSKLTAAEKLVVDQEYDKVQAVMRTEQKIRPEDAPTI